MKKNRIAIFASGSGTNAQKIMEYFENHDLAEVVLILSNNANAGVLDRAKKFDVPTYVFDKATFTQSEDVKQVLINKETDWVILAGFLWLVPEYMIKAFPDRIINIHPALLPKYGGKGMYGMRVHETVSQAGDTETGISIHYVNQQYDEGQIIFQAKCQIKPGEDPLLIAEKIHLLEHEFFPKVIEDLVKKSI